SPSPANRHAGGATRISPHTMGKNPKSETRNPKQIQSTNARTLETERGQVLIMRILALELVSYFGFRISIYRGHFFVILATNSSIAASMIWSPGLPSHLRRMTPSWSMTNRVGQPRTRHSFEIGPCVPSAPFQNERQVIPCLTFLSLISSLSLSLLT